MNSQTVEQFWQLYYALPGEIREAARDADQRFAADSTHPGLSFLRLKATSNLWSVRITRDYRAVGLLQSDTITWFWIGNHREFDKTFPK